MFCLLVWESPQMWHWNLASRLRLAIAAASVRVETPFGLMILNCSTCVPSSAERTELLKSFSYLWQCVIWLSHVDWGDKLEAGWTCGDGWWSLMPCEVFSVREAVWHHCADWMTIPEISSMVGYSRGRPPISFKGESRRSGPQLASSEISLTGVLWSMFPAENIVML